MQVNTIGTFSVAVGIQLYFCLFQETGPAALVLHSKKIKFQTLYYKCKKVYLTPSWV